MWDEVPDNVLVDTVIGDAAATERAFAIADHIVEMEFHVARVTGVPMEPRAALGHWDAATGRGTLWAGSGGAVRQKTELARCSASRPIESGWCRSMSAPVSGRATGSMRGPAGGGSVPPSMRIQ